MSNSLVERLEAMGATPYNTRDLRERSDAMLEAANLLQEMEVELAGITAAYERMTAYMILHNGVGLYCSGDMRDAYSDMKVRAEKAEVELSRLRKVGGPSVWVVGDTAFTSESEAIEEIRQWGPSDAIAVPYYADPIQRDWFAGYVDCCDAKGAWLVLTDEATDIWKGQRVIVIPERPE